VPRPPESRWSIDAHDYFEKRSGDTIRFTIVGRTHFLFPAQRVDRRVYEVSGDVMFTPQTGRRYVSRECWETTIPPCGYWTPTGEVMDTESNSEPAGANDQRRSHLHESRNAVSSLL